MSHIKTNPLMDPPPRHPSVFAFAVFPSSRIMMGESMMIATRIISPRREGLSHMGYRFFSFMRNTAQIMVCAW